MYKVILHNNGRKKIILNSKYLTSLLRIYDIYIFPFLALFSNKRFVFKLLHVLFYNMCKQYFLKIDVYSVFRTLLPLINNAFFSYFWMEM